VDGRPIVQRGGFLKLVVAMMLLLYLERVWRYWLLLQKGRQDQAKRSFCLLDVDISERFYIEYSELAVLGERGSIYMLLFLLLCATWMSSRCGPNDVRFLKRENYEATSSMFVYTCVDFG